MEFLLRQGILHLSHRHQLLDLHDLSGDVRVNGVEDRLHSLSQAERHEDAVCAAGEADGGAFEGYSEVWHGGCVGGGGCCWRIVEEDDAVDGLSG